MHKKTEKVATDKASQRKIDAKIRRDMRAKAKRNGDPMGLLDNNQSGPKGETGKVDNLLTTYKRAEAKNELLQTLGAKRNKCRASQDAYKALQNHWYNRTQHVDDYLSDGKPVTKGRETITRGSKPLI